MDNNLRSKAVLDRISKEISAFIYFSASAQIKLSIIRQKWRIEIKIEFSFQKIKKYIEYMDFMT